MPKFYITTPIYYVNDRPHIGSAYATIVPDVLARYHRMLGNQVYFLTGTDENAQKNVEAAEKAGQDVQKYVDTMSAAWQETWDELNISNDDFIRTTEDRHKIGVEKFWRLVEAAGDIYKGAYEGLYCVGCEEFKTESDLTSDGLCPIHHRKPDVVKEDNYFFRASKFREPLLAHIDSHPDFIQPSSRRHEVVNYIKDHLNDVSISRPTKGWGISVPGDETQVIYVWFDALINYLTAIGYGTDETTFAQWWPADLHVVGKDITKFHCGLWPAMLLSAGLPLPHRVFAHGFFTIDGQKMSKSLGNVIDPRSLAETYGLDAFRLFLLREIPFGSDGDFSIERVAARYDADLVNGLGNTVSRILALADGRPLNVGRALQPLFEQTWSEYQAAFASIEPHGATDAVWRALRGVDQYIDTTAPWKLAKDESKADELTEVLGTLTEALRQLAWLLIPLLPDTAHKIFAALSIEREIERPLEEARVWGGTVISRAVKIQPLFPRL